MSSTPSTVRIAKGVHARVLGDEVVIVDEQGQAAHVLQGASAEAWGVLTGERDFARSDAAWDAALAELTALGLVEETGSSRRDFLRQAGTVAVGASVITIGLPSVAAAQSMPPAQTKRTITFVGPNSTPRNTWTNYTVTITAPSSQAPGTALISVPSTAKLRVGASGNGGSSVTVSSGEVFQLKIDQNVTVGSKVVMTATAQLDTAVVQQFEVTALAANAG